MLTYRYTARDPATGQKIRSQLQAEDEQGAYKLIQKQGLTPVDIAVSNGTLSLAKFTNRVKTKDKIMFTRQLATLINAGLPLVQSLRTVTNQTQSKPLKVIATEIIAAVESGSALSLALAKHEEVFGQIYISLVAAGETSGTLDSALERLATQQEKDAEILSKVRGAMVYPAIVLLVMLAVIAFMIVQVLPQVKVLYNGLPGQHLPPLTTALLAVSDFIIGFWWVVIGVIGGIAFFMSRWFKTLGGRTIVDKFKMKGWPIGPLFMKLYMARFARSATTLVASGVPLLQVLEITANAISNVHIAHSIKIASDKVKGGKSLSEAIKNDENFLPLVSDMLHIGEESGAIEQMMGRVADFYEKEVDTQIKTVSTIIEPVLMIVLGIVAIIIVAAVLMPIYGLAGKNLGG